MDSTHMRTNNAPIRDSKLSLDPNEDLKLQSKSIETSVVSSKLPDSSQATETKNSIDELLKVIEAEPKVSQKEFKAVPVQTTQSSASVEMLDTDTGKTELPKELEGIPLPDPTKPTLHPIPAQKSDELKEELPVVTSPVIVSSPIPTTTSVPCALPQSLPEAPLASPIAQPLPDTVIIAPEAPISPEGSASSEALPKAQPLQQPSAVVPEVAPVVQDTLETKKVVDSSAVAKWDITQKYIISLEELTNSRVLVLYINMRSSLSEEDVEYIYNHVAKIGRQAKISVLVAGPGGSGIAATRVIYLLRQFCDELNIIVPGKAASALTMLSLGGDKILMGPISSLSPIDTSIHNHQLAPKGHDNAPASIEVNQIQKFIELCNSGMSSDKVDDINKSPYSLLSKHIHPIVIGSIQRIVSLSKMLTFDILKTHMRDINLIERIVSQLNDGFPIHSYPITFAKAQELGIKVEIMNSELNSKCLNFLRVLKVLSDGGASENQGVRVNYTRDVIFECTDLRTVYYVEKKYSLSEGKWSHNTSKSQYNIYGPKEDELGFVKIKVLDASEL